jgi:hypothetical protein
MLNSDFTLSSSLPNGEYPNKKQVKAGSTDSDSYSTFVNLFKDNTFKIPLDPNLEFFLIQKANALGEEINRVKNGKTLEQLAIEGEREDLAYILLSSDKFKIQRLENSSSTTLVSLAKKIGSNILLEKIASYTNLPNLPPESWCIILSSIDSYKELSILREVNKTFKNIIEDIIFPGMGIEYKSSAGQKKYCSTFVINPNFITPLETIGMFIHWTRSGFLERVESISLDILGLAANDPPEYYQGMDVSNMSLTDGELSINEEQEIKEELISQLQISDELKKMHSLQHLSLVGEFTLIGGLLLEELADKCKNLVEIDIEAITLNRFNFLKKIQPSQLQYLTLNFCLTESFWEFHQALETGKLTKLKVLDMKRLDNLLSNHSELEHNPLISIKHANIPLEELYLSLSRLDFEVTDELVELIQATPTLKKIGIVLEYDLKDPEEDLFEDDAQGLTIEELQEFVEKTKEKFPALEFYADQINLGAEEGSSDEESLDDL